MDVPTLRLFLRPILTATSVWNTGETGDTNTMLCPIKVNSNTIELAVHTSCYCVLDLLFVYLHAVQLYLLLLLNKLS